MAPEGALSAMVKVRSRVGRAGQLRHHEAGDRELVGLERAELLPGQLDLPEVLVVHPAGRHADVQLQRPQIGGVGLRGGELEIDLHRRAGVGQAGERRQPGGQRRAHQRGVVLRCRDRQRRGPLRERLGRRGDRSRADLPAGGRLEAEHVGRRHRRHGSHGHGHVIGIASVRASHEAHHRQRDGGR